MVDLHLGVVEARFADLIWENAPISSSALVELAGEALSWKKSTTYTVLKRLCEKGLFVNDHSTVRVVISKEEFRILRGEELIRQEFDGSLPAFFAAFSKRQSLTKEEKAQLVALLTEDEEE